MKRLLLILVLVTSVSCARRVVLPPVPPELPKVVEVISHDTTLTPEQKAQLIRQAVEATERIYLKVLERLDKQGGNVKETVLQILTSAPGIAALIWRAK